LLWTLQTNALWAESRPVSLSENGKESATSGRFGAREDLEGIPVVMDMARPSKTALAKEVHVEMNSRKISSSKRDPILPERSGSEIGILILYHLNRVPPRVRLIATSGSDRREKCAQSELFPFKLNLLDVGGFGNRDLFRCSTKISLFWAWVTG
jgi:hypothetical protein